MWGGPDRGAAAVTPREELVHALTLERFTLHRRVDNSPVPHMPLPPVDTAGDNTEAET
jgi:hypothetical protein